MVLVIIVRAVGVRGGEGGGIGSEDGRNDVGGALDLDLDDDDEYDEEMGGGSVEGRVGKRKRPPSSVSPSPRTFAESGVDGDDRDDVAPPKASDAAPPASRPSASRAYSIPSSEQPSSSR